MTESPTVETITLTAYWIYVKQGGLKRDQNHLMARQARPQ